MPVFYVHLKTPTGIRLDEVGIDFVDLDAAYLDVCAAIPETARDLRRDGKDPFDCTYLICDEQGATLVEAAFSAFLPPRRPN